MDADFYRTDFFLVWIGIFVNEPSVTTVCESRIPQRVSPYFLWEMPRTLEERALFGSMGSEINENKEETSLHGGIIFRPLFVSWLKNSNSSYLHTMHGTNNLAHWRYACWKSYEPREHTPHKRRNAPAVEGQQVNFSGSQPWQAGSQPTSQQ